MIKAVIFDIDGVLLDSFEANLVFFQDLTNKAGYKPPTREEFQGMFHLNMWDAVKRMTGSDSEEEIRRIWEMGKRRDIKYPIELLTVPENCEATLMELSKNYTLGIVTSRIKESVFEAPELIALQHYFQVTVSYEDTEKHKPNPEPLLLCAKKLGVSPDESVYIGDVENDVIAAHAAGMKGIIFSKNKPGDADAYTALFEELPSIIIGL